jgi:ABC-type Fe3+-siderophore transport system permease subunit
VGAIMLWMFFLLLLVFGVIGIRHPWKWFNATRMKNQQNQDEEAMPEREEGKAKAGRFGNFVFLRILFAAVVFRATVGGITAMFVELAKTNDFVLEYRYWISVSIYLVGAMLSIIIFVVSRPKDVPR